VTADGTSSPQARVHNFSISLDGFGTGDGITVDEPFGHAGQRLHEWMFATRFWRSMVGKGGGSSGVDDSFAERHGIGIGAEIMGRGKFGVQTGPWTDVGTDDEWRGWWGPNPPFHTPVFVLTHHERPSIEMEGGTVFHFVTSGPGAAMERAKEAAAGKDVQIGGGVSTIRQGLEARLIDELHVAIAPRLLGSGEHLWHGLDLTALGYECATHLPSAAATHVVLTKRR